MHIVGFYYKKIRIVYDIGGARGGVVVKALRY